MKQLTLLLLSLMVLCQCANTKPSKQVPSPKAPQPSVVQTKHLNEPVLTGNQRGYKTASYTVRGRRYHPMTVDKALHHDEVGVASFYEGAGGKTANGERPKRGQIYAAHKTLPIPCVVRVTNLANGRSLDMRVNDRGPFIGSRVIDVSRTAAHKLGFYHKGLQRVRIQVLSVGDGSYKRVSPVHKGSKS